MNESVADAIRRLSEALKRVNSGWIPVQDAVIETVEEGISTGEYENDSEALLEDLKTDPAIYATVLRQLGCSRSDSGAQVIDDSYSLSLETQRNFDPSHSIEKLPYNELLRLVTTARQLGSNHSLLSMEEFQAAMIEEVTVSTVAAETLAFALGQDPELAYSTALLRSLGSSLAAWNFPKEFETAFYSLSSELPLSERVRSTLGFSPEMIGSSLVLEWGVTNDIAIALRAKKSNLNTEWDLSAEASVATQLAHICEISELLAQVVHVEQQAQALEAWPSVQAAFSELLGPYGLEMVLEQSREKLLLASPHPISLPLPPILQAMAKRIEGIEQRFAKLEKNTFLKKLPGDPQKRIAQFYRTFDAHSVAKGAVLTLLDEVLPQLGIARASIYEISECGQRLHPSYSFGKTGTGLQAIPISRTFGYGINVVTAYRLKTLICEPRTRTSGSYFNIAIPLFSDGVAKPRVLSLSTEYGYFDAKANEPQHYARALATLLEDLGS